MCNWAISLSGKEAGTVFKTGWMYSVEERNKEWRWQDCFITNPSSPFWTNAQARSAWMWKTTFTATVGRLASPSLQCHTENPCGNTTSTTCIWMVEAIMSSKRSQKIQLSSDRKNISRTAPALKQDNEQNTFVNAKCIVK